MGQGTGPVRPSPLGLPLHTYTLPPNLQDARIDAAIGIVRARHDPALGHNAAAIARE